MISNSVRGAVIRVPTELFCGKYHIRKLDPMIAAVMPAVRVIPFLLAKPA